jgi:hypothetical protein
VRLINSLSSGPIGIKDATQDEYDLILEIRQLRNTPRTKIQPLWTPGHPSKEDPRGEQVKNAKAHALAVRQLHSTDPGLHDDDGFSTHIITVLHNNCPITKGLPQQIIADIHYKPLQDKILKDTSWTIEAFNKVDWNGLHRALLKLPRPRQLSISKYIHGLWDVNEQNHRYYQQPADFPYCSSRETMLHLLTCSSQEATATGQQSMQIFNKALLATCTPPDVVNTIVNYISTMESNVKVDHSQSSSDLLSQAVSNQANIGWEHFLRGRLSQCWRQVFISYLPWQDKKRETKADTWLWKVIHAFWDYSFSIWEARNLTVHGRTETAKEGKLLKTLKREVKTLYQSFATDPHMVPQSRKNLFDKPQDYLLQLPTSYIHCWLLSVREAIETRKFRANKQKSRQCQLMENFFKPRQKSHP